VVIQTNPSHEFYEFILKARVKFLAHLQAYFAMPPPPPSDGEVSTKPVSTKLASKSVKQFTWKELSRLNTPENAHVAVRGKVR